MDFNISTGELRSPTHDPSKHHARTQVEALAASLKEPWGDLKEAIRMSQARVSSRDNENR